MDPVNKAPEPYLNDEQFKQLESELEAFCNAAADKRRKKEVTWLLARRMVSGDQWVRKTEAPGNSNPLVEEVNLPGRMEKWKITVNRLLPGLSTRLAHVLKNKPIGVVMPETQDEEDRNAARIGDEVVEYYYRALDYHGKLAERAGPEMFTTGNVFFHAYWDPMAGPMVPVQKYLTDEAGEPVLDQITQQPVPLDPVMMPRGEPALEVVEADELYVDPAAKAMDDCQGVVRQHLRPVDEVKQMLAKMGVDEEVIEEIKPLDPNDGGWGATAAAAAKMAGYSMTDLSSRCEVRVAWFKPNAEKGFAEGLRAIVVNRKLIVADKTPDGHEHVPFIHMMEIPVPGDFYGTSSVIQAMPIQKALNLTVSRDEYRRTVQRPKLVADHEAGLDEAAFTNEDSEVVFKNHGYTVDWLQAPTYESDPRAIERYIQFIDDLFGNVAILMGESDGEVRSGRQAFIQGEYAGTALSGPARSIERACQRIGRALLKLLKANTDEQRTIQIVGKSRAIEVLHFQGADLEGAGDYYVEPGSALPMSPQAKKQLILDLVDRQILLPQQALRLLSMPSDIDAKMDEERLDRDRATEENMIFASLTEEAVRTAAMEATQEETLKAASPLGPTPMWDRLDAMLEKLGVEARPDFENNVVHLESHNQFRKSRKYRELPKVVRALVDQHCDKHVPQPMMPGEESGGAPGEEAGPEAGAPQALQPGMPPAVGNGGELADVTGDIAAQMPPMPPTPGAQTNG
jgi:hypothetical protein